MSEFYNWPKGESIEVGADLGEAIKGEMLRAEYDANLQRRELIGWAMSGHAFLSLFFCLQESQMMQAREVYEKYEFLGKPIFIHQSAQPFLPLFSPKEAGRMEYEARKK